MAPQEGVLPTTVEADEKAIGGPPGYDSSSGKAVRGAISEEAWATRAGLNLTSFKKREYGRGIVELDRAMSSRHLHMIAIGGSIGAGFFVGSGGALSKGGPGSLFIDFLLVGIMMFNVGTS
ncbi:amino-acid permease inda1 [Colletotrichum higginsianum]|nr:amino-acid permease inda1 [Colletotrichum higginsianum]